MHQTVKSLKENLKTLIFYYEECNHSARFEEIFSCAKKLIECLDDWDKGVNKNLSMKNGGHPVPFVMDNE